MIDDFSDDGGEEIIKNYNNYSFITLLHRKDYNENPNISSKQNALDLGAEFAKYDFLVFTDADMIFGENWLENYRISIEKNGAEFIFGRTRIYPTKSPLEIVQETQLDFLFALAWFFCKIGIDTSCMGNNFAVSKELYVNIGGHKAIGFSITEDKKLLSEARKRKVPIFCVCNFPADACTKPVDAKTFLFQMLRWIKGAMSESKFLTVILVIFAIGNLLIIPSIVELLFFIPVYIKNRIKMRRLFILPFVFFIETIILIPSLFWAKPKWKGRDV
jgi:cellulose synthase/poly-beta-1,6-N-acetylglucosamine synthase-like glycosyltransferase